MANFVLPTPPPFPSNYRTYLPHVAFAITDFEHEQVPPRPQIVQGAAPQGGNRRVPIADRRGAARTKDKMREGH